MAIVYRVETSEGLGPYSHVAPRFPEIEEYHPNPLDAGIKGEHGWVFGFSYLEEVPLWFSGVEVEILQESSHEWLVSKYEVDPRYLSSVPLQAAFDKRHAELLGCFSLSELVGVSRSRLSTARTAELESLFKPRETVPTPSFPALRGLLPPAQDKVERPVSQFRLKATADTDKRPAIRLRARLALGFRSPTDTIS